MYHHIQAAVHIRRVPLETDEPKMRFEAQTLSQTAQLGDGKLRSLGMVDWPTNEIEPHREAGLLLEQLRCCLEKYILSFPPCVGRDEANADRSLGGGRKAGEPVETLWLGRRRREAVHIGSMQDDSRGQSRKNGPRIAVNRFR